MLEVQVSGTLRDALDGAASVQVEADSIRELLRKLVERYPRLQRQVETGVAVSINGDIYRDRRDEPIPSDAEVFLLPRIEGG
ncbi:MAG: MoaD/ThiS family protein [Pseudomonadales bacterium]